MTIDEATRDITKAHCTKHQIRKILRELVEGVICDYEVHLGLQSHIKFKKQLRAKHLTT